MALPLLEVRFIAAALLDELVNVIVPVDDALVVSAVMVPAVIAPDWVIALPASRLNAPLPTLDVPEPRLYPAVDLM